MSTADHEARRLGSRWLAAFPGSTGWLPGMKVLAVSDAPEGERDLESGITTEPAGPAFVVAVDKDGATCAWSEHPGTADSGLTLRDDVPDLRDPATKGACLAILRESLECPLLQVSPALPPTPPRWYAYRNADDEVEPRWNGPTEAEVLVLAAEAYAALRSRLRPGG